MYNNFRLFTNSEDPKVFQVIKDSKKLNTFFLINYLSFEPDNREMSRVANKYLWKIKDDIVFKLLYLMVKKQKGYIPWKHYVKKGKITNKNFINGACKIFGWSKREYFMHEKLFINNKEVVGKIAWMVGLENKDRKELGLDNMKTEKVKRPEKHNMQTLEKWF